MIELEPAAPTKERRPCRYSLVGCGVKRGLILGFSLYEFRKLARTSLGGNVQTSEARVYINIDYT